MNPRETNRKFGQAHLNRTAGLTAIIRSQNDEETIIDSIESVYFAEKVLVLDSNSVDGTVALARLTDVEVILDQSRGNSNHGSGLKNKVKSPWVLLMNADEKVSPSLHHEIIRTLDRDPEEKGFRIPLFNSFMGKKIRAINPKNEAVIRLIKTDLFRFDEPGPVKNIPGDDPVGDLKHVLVSERFVSCNGYMKKINQTVDIEIRTGEMGTENIGWHSLVLKPAFRFLKYLFVQGALLNGVAGLTFSYFEAHTLRLKYIKLWMKQNALPAHDKIR